MLITSWSKWSYYLPDSLGLERRRLTHVLQMEFDALFFAKRLAPHISTDPRACSWHLRVPPVKVESTGILRVEGKRLLWVLSPGDWIQMNRKVDQIGTGTLPGEPTSWEHRFSLEDSRSVISVASRPWATFLAVEWLRTQPTHVRGNKWYRDVMAGHRENFNFFFFFSSWQKLGPGLENRMLRANLLTKFWLPRNPTETKTFLTRSTWAPLV